MKLYILDLNNSEDSMDEELAGRLGELHMRLEGYLSFAKQLSTLFLFPLQFIVLFTS